MDQKKQRFTLLITQELYDQIHERAWADKRARGNTDRASMNAVIIQALEEFFAPKWGEPLRVSSARTPTTKEKGNV